MMKDELIKYMKDCSTEDEFCFKFLCSSCGTWWYSKPIPFSRAGRSVSDENKKVIYGALYRREWMNARNTVLDDAGNNGRIIKAWKIMFGKHNITIIDKEECL